MKVEEEQDNLIVSVTVTNTGGVDGTETVQLYMQDVTASLTRPVKELKGFTKVRLKPGESKEAVLTLPKSEMGFYDNSGAYVREDGLFRIYMGHSSKECEMREINLQF